RTSKRSSAAPPVRRLASCSRRPEMRNSSRGDGFRLPSPPYAQSKLRRGSELKENPVKRALKAGKPQIGTWLSLGSIAAARFMARAGFPWLTVDMEHTHTDIQTAAFMFGAIADAGCVPLARIPTGKHELIKMVL